VQTKNLNPIYQMPLLQPTITRIGSGGPSGNGDDLYYLKSQPIVSDSITADNIFALNNLDVGNDLTVVGDSQFGGKVDISGNVVVDGTMLVLGDVTATVLGYLPQQTDLVLTREASLSATPAAGYSTQDVGATFTVTTTGLYLFNATMGFNCDVTTGATVGASDSYNMAIIPASGPAVALGNASLKPYTMPDTNSGGFDYGLNNMAYAYLTAGVTYKANISVYNVSGTLSCPGGIACGLYLIALC